MSEIHVLDVGHGNSAIAVGDEWSVLVDAAPGPIVLEAVEHLSIRRLDRIVISHRDADHTGGVVPVLACQELEIGTLFIAADAAKDPKNPEAALLLAALADAKQSGRCLVSRDLDDALPPGRVSGGGLDIEVLAPTFATAMTGSRGKSPAGGTMTSNTVSAVLRIRLPNGLRVLLPGDIDHMALAELGEKGTDLRADIVVFPHHGSHSVVPDEREFAQDVMRAVEPNTVLFSIGRGAKVRPTEDVVRGVFDVNSDAYIGCTQLSKGCLPLDSELPSDPAEMIHLTRIPGAGAPRCRSCAGSMTLDSNATMTGPSEDAHQRYIDLAASQPMCRRLRP